MALIDPFLGYRFNPEIAGDLNRVVAQPYDKIPVDLQQEYYRRSPHNIVRVTRSEEKNRDPQTDYPVAGSLLRRWLADGVLRREAVPAIYAYSQTYEFEGETRVQRGFIALVDLKHSARGIKPHERTLDEPKSDRLRLMRRIEANEDLIYTLYTDDRLTVNRALREQTDNRPPDIEVSDDFGVLHQVWAIGDRPAIRRIQDAMVPEELFIADGHHRFETSLNFMRECEDRGWRPAAVESFDRRMIACFNSADQGTTILPTHRLVRGLPSFDSVRFLEAAEPFFAVQACNSPQELWAAMRAGRQDHVFGFYPGDRRSLHLLRLKEEGRVDPLMLTHGEAYRHLDVSILHTLLLDRILGIDERKLAEQSHIDYARDRDACLAGVNDGTCQAAFFLNPTTVEQVQRVALLGERMPQKSTDFYPKLLTGLVLMRMRISRGTDRDN
jgi:uncharacterized protein (DUF1015 family)